MSPTHQRPDRRTFLLLGAGLGTAGLLSACSLNNPFSSTDEPVADAVQDLAPDVAVAVQAVGLLRAARARLDATTTAYPTTAAALDGLATVYAAHLDALTAAVPDGIDTSPPTRNRAVAGSPSGARAAAAKDAEKLHRQLVELAVQARSGPFARLLGTMSAALSQQAVLLTRKSPA